jgi:hypothetical protein
MNPAGALGTWVMLDGLLGGTLSLNHGMPGWSALAGDFNGDGTGDIMWQNTTTGTVSTWLFNTDGNLI